MPKQGTLVPTYIAQTGHKNFAKIMPFGQESFQISAFGKHLNRKSALLRVYYQVNYLFLARANPATAPAGKAKKELTL